MQSLQQRQTTCKPLININLLYNCRKYIMHWGNNDVNDVFVPPLRWQPITFSAMEPFTVMVEQKIRMNLSRLFNLAAKLTSNKNIKLIKSFVETPNKMTRIRNTNNRRQQACKAIMLRTLTQIQLVSWIVRITTIAMNDHHMVLV